MLAVDYIASLSTDPDTLWRGFLKLVRGGNSEQAAETAIALADGREGGDLVIRVVELVGWYNWGVPMPAGRHAYLTLLSRDERVAVGRALVASLDAACPG